MLVRCMIGMLNLIEVSVAGCLGYDVLDSC